MALVTFNVTDNVNDEVTNQAIDPVQNLLIVFALRQLAA
jgi:hypothetical protein